jgi:putative inorganic carbon (HCO3(-)) transporter
MAESLRRELSKESLTGRMHRWIAALQSPEQPGSHVIDAAIVAFLLFAVLSITGAQAAILVALAAWLYERVRARDDRPLDLPLLLPIAAFYLATVLASVTAMDPLQSFKDLRNVFEPAFFFLLVNHVSDRDRATRLSHILVTAATLMAVYGLTQAIAEGPAFRVRGTMSIYMTFAGILMLIALLVLAQLLCMPRSRLSYGHLCALVLLTATLVMTHTRGAWIGFVAGVILIVGFRQKRFLLALPVVAVVIFLASPEAVRMRIRSLVDPQDVTARERLYMWGSGLQMLRDHPWTGVGINGVKHVYQAYKHPNAVRDQRAHLHSNPMQIAAERGLIGVACWLWIWVAFYRQAWKIFRGLEPTEYSAHALVIGSLASVTGFHVAGLFEYNFGDSEVIMLVYFLMALPYVVRVVDREARVYETPV